ncbi:MAG TPA: hypothetical protein VM840_12165, partial [Actinomycetota bacterium]|nr:hypothetical protein [Actinomycetota bacterium]
WGVGRWRATLGAVLVAAGLVGATVAATIPLVTRSADWVARGGPSPNDAHAIAFLGTCGVAALAGRWLRSTQPDPRPLAVRPAQRGPAPIRERRGDPGVPR